ncbi:hypothetical protein AKJ09_06607 [Labilithrix luteola]|uniref:DUF72 domain-containing protein n=1 Tax=Labilithrix luteola TaxID=1391654 RepID=A0A0K1Q2E9_9BACT|nr:DUF72 domain-containing protein [Labilithrix luteola]AKU99943.1 hypothetical protein AKJ09_06607 [Labilithrix luteola]
MTDKPPRTQLSLFGDAGQHEPDVAPHVDPSARELATHLPRRIRFGTSSWSFPGWGGIVFAGKPTQDALARRGLTAYAQNPLLRTVGLDRSYYGPLREDELAQYAAQLDRAKEITAKSGQDLPPFRMVSKVWEEITTAVFPSHLRYGARAGTKNPTFLDASRFLSEVLEPYRRAFLPYVGPFVFELTPMPRGAIDERTLVARIDAFLGKLPTGFQWAFELRNEELLGQRWFDMLAANGVAHVFTYWTAMPAIRAQLAHPRSIGARFVITRLMLPPYTRYETKKAEFAPFDKVVAPQPEMRDDVIKLLEEAIERGCEDVYVLVNNKAEGSSPLTVRALAERVVHERIGVTDIEF